MTTDPPCQDDSVAMLIERLDKLEDLFRRRLLDDRDKRAAIEDLQARLTRAEDAAAAVSLGPLVNALALVIERAKRAEPSASLVASVVVELEQVLESVVGVSPIEASPGDAIDPGRHEVDSVSGDGPDLRVEELLRVGYQASGVVVRPALVAARWAAEEGASSS